ncbi:hypothetical protein ACIQOV_32260 [Kitasatospora sp. NPDC091257]|uniref:hypothetical protein n=1 Tax=Kitasatospora sp. NPDC091257 TaxID=3364084 RepID=UPI00380934CA
MAVVNHGAVLEALQPLPGGVVAGQRQVRRNGPLIAIASLEPSRFSDEWEGIRIRIVSRAAGELDSNVFLFTEHDVLPAEGNGRIAVGNAPGIEGRSPICTARLAGAVDQYVHAFW